MTMLGDGDAHEDHSVSLDGAKKAQRQTIPIGTHVIPLDPAVAAHIRAVGDDAVAGLVASRVWIEQIRGNLRLHIGDVGWGD